MNLTLLLGKKYTKIYTFLWNGRPLFSFERACRAQTYEASYLLRGRCSSLVLRSWVSYIVAHLSKLTTFLPAFSSSFVSLLNISKPHAYYIQQIQGLSWCRWVLFFICILWWPWPWRCLRDKHGVGLWASCFLLLSAQQLYFLHTGVPRDFCLEGNAFTLKKWFENHCFRWSFSRWLLSLEKHTKTYVIRSYFQPKRFKKWQCSMK